MKKKREDAASVLGVLCPWSLIYSKGSSCHTISISVGKPTGKELVSLVSTTGPKAREQTWKQVSLEQGSGKITALRIP